MIGQWIAMILVTIGALFFIAGSIGLLRFPDVFSRLHALTKADNLGLGLVVLGLVAQAHSLFFAAKLLIIWLLVLLGSATVCCLIAGNQVREQLPNAHDQHI